MTLQTGEILNNRYRIVKKLGQGGYGAIYRAWDVNFEMACAVKENFETSAEARRQFMREARILHTLRHPNLPLVKDYFVIPEQGQYLVMDFIEGQDLFEMLERAGKPLPEAKVKEWLFQICEALVYMHNHEPPVIHRDIKPANIKITPEGNVRLVDFGISKLYEPGTPTTLGARAVTPGYSPFEQYGHAPTDVRTDIYSLGATVYTLLTGEVPVESIARMAGTELKPPRELNPDISSQMEAAILKALETMPADRYSNVEALRDAMLGTVLAGQESPRSYEKTEVIPRDQLGIPVEAPTRHEEARETPSVSITDREQREIAMVAAQPQAQYEPTGAAGRGKRRGRSRWLWLLGGLILILVSAVAVFAVIDPFGWQASEEPPPEEEYIPLEEEHPPDEVIHIGGVWRGEFRDYSREDFVMELVIEFFQEPGQDSFEGIVIHFPPESQPEEFPLEGVVEGEEVKFSDEPGRHFFGMIHGECMEGEVAWDCFECEVFAGFHVCRE